MFLFRGEVVILNNEFMLEFFTRPNLVLCVMYNWIVSLAVELLLSYRDILQDMEEW